MKSITIHNLDNDLEKLVHQKAHQTKMSLNKTIQALLKQALGLSDNQKAQPRNQFQEFCGAWKPQDVKAFNEKVKLFEHIETDDWK